jgi:hypothetical protein
MGATGQVGGSLLQLIVNQADIDDGAAAFSKVLGQPFTYDPQPPLDFLQRVLAAGAESGLHKVRLQ